MNTIRTIIHDRRIEVPAPSDLADGTEVLVTMTPVSNKVGLNESEWDTSPQEIERWCQRVSALQPLIFTDEEKAQLEADRKARKQWECERFEEHANRAASLWE